MATYEIKYQHLTWINIVHPTQADVEALHVQFPFIHPLNLEDVRSPLERPKIDEHDAYLFIVMHFPLWDIRDSLSRPSEVDFFVFRGYVVTIHNGLLKPLQDLYDECEGDESARQKLLGRGANHAFHEILDGLVDYIIPILRKVDSNIRQIEDSIFSSDTRTVIRDISLGRRDLIALRRIIRHQIPIVEQLERAEHPIIHEDLEEYFGDIADHLYKARDIVDENYEVIVGLAETVDTLASHKINEVMRILTVISVIMLPLTLISSVYGMNVPLPMEDSPYGFLAVCILMLLISVIMLIYFRRRGWL